MKNKTENYIFSSSEQENLPTTEPKLNRYMPYWKIPLDPRM